MMMTRSVSWLFKLRFATGSVNGQHKPDIIHCHDHHTGLIPFMIKYVTSLTILADVPTVFTIHNAEYQGWIGWDKYYLLPPYDPYKWGMLDWKNNINPLASAVKCAWKVTTVSPSYHGGIAIFCQWAGKFNAI